MSASVFILSLSVLLSHLSSPLHDISVFRCPLCIVAAVSGVCLLECLNMDKRDFMATVVCVGIFLLGLIHLPISLEVGVWECGEGLKGI